MRRREFIAGLGSAAAWPVVARAQQQAVPVIGLLSPQSARDDYKDFIIPFLQGLKETGYVEGQNVALEYRWAENKVDRLPRHHSSCVTLRLRFNLPQPGVSIIRAAPHIGALPRRQNAGSENQRSWLR